MISHINGTVITINTLDGTISVSVNGIGYLVTVGQKYSATITINMYISLFIEEITKDTGTTLYGFKYYEQMIWFRSLLKVNGVGPKAGIGVIDTISVMDLTRAIAEGRPEILQNIGGLSEKISNRITNELKKEPAKNTKIFASTQTIKSTTSVHHAVEVDIPTLETKTKNIVDQNVNQNDVISALVNLGFDYNRSFSAVCDTIQDAETLEDAIKYALKKMNI